MKQHRNKGEKSITDRIAERAEALAVNRNLFLGKKKYIEIKHGGFKDVSSAKQQHRAGPGFIYLEYTFGSRKEIWLSDKELTSASSLPFSSSNR